MLTGWLAAECSGIPTAAPAAALVMAVIPAHAFRSVGGLYDNESVAVSVPKVFCCNHFRLQDFGETPLPSCIQIAFMVLASFLWTRSLRGPSSWPLGAAAGMAYACMAASWGGYVFLVNVVALHAVTLLAAGRATQAVHRAFTAFYIVGTLCAMQVRILHPLN